MRREEVIEQIQGLFKDSCTELFGSLNCEVAIGEQNGESFEEVPIACIDAGSGDVEFLIALQLPLSILAMTYPVTEGITMVREDYLEDWISELSNQLIGRLKRKLTSHECNVDIGLPTTYFGAELESLLSANGANSERKTYFFDIDGELCACSIALEVFNDATSYVIDPNSHDDDQNEGELELF